MNIKGRVFLTDENTLHNEWEKYKATRAERWNHTSVKAKDFSKLSYAERKTFGQTSLKEDFWASVGKINGAREATIDLAASAVNLIEMGGQALTMSNAELAFAGLEMVGRTALAVNNILSKGIGNSLMDYARNEISSLGKWAGSNDAYTYGLGAGKFASNTALAALPAAEMIAASKGVTLGGLFGRTVKVGERGLNIAASSPSEIAWGYGRLSNRQAKLLEALAQPGRSMQVYKSNINPTDLAALTAHTGDEFAMFTLGSRRIIIRGTDKRLVLPAPLQDKLLSEGWRWSAHTHPGTLDKVLMSSGGDRSTLEAINQGKSMILNSAGRRSIFDQSNDFLVTEHSTESLIFRPRG